VERKLREFYPTLQAVKNLRPDRSFFYNSNVVQLGCVRLVARHSSAMLLADDDGRHFINVTLCGEAAFHTHGGVVSVHRDTSEIVNPGGRHELLFDEGYMSIMAVYDPRGLIEHIQTCSESSRKKFRSIASPGETLDPGAQSMLRHVLMNTVQTIDILSAHQSEDIVAARLEQSLLHAVAIALNPDYSLMVPGQTTMDTACVSAAREIIETRACEGLTESDLALALNVPLHELQRVFLRVLARLPSTAIKDRQIDLAYQDLILAHEGVRVQDIANRYGFNPSLLSAIIQNRYGERPLQIIKRNRSYKAQSRSSRGGECPARC